MKKNLLLLPALALTLFSSCSNEEELIGAADPQNEIIVATEMGNFRARVKARAGYTTETLREFGLIIQSDNADYTYNNKRMTGGPLEGWTTDGTMYWSNRNAAHCVIAYAPYRTDEVNAQSQIDVKVATDQSTADAVQSSDFIAMKNGAYVPANDMVDGKLMVTMNHMLSKVFVKITYPEAYAAEGANPITNLTVSGMKVDAIFNLATWGGGQPGSDLFLNANGADEVIKPFEFGHDAEKRLATYEFISIPQDQNTISIAFNAAGVAYKWSYDKLSLKSGEALTINLSVDKEGVQLGGNVVVGDWTTGDDINGGNPSEDEHGFTIAELSKTNWKALYTTPCNNFWGLDAQIDALWDGLPVEGSSDHQLNNCWLSHQIVKGTSMAADYQVPWEAPYTTALAVIDLGKTQWLAGVAAMTAGFGDTTFERVEFYATDAAELKAEGFTEDDLNNMFVNGNGIDGKADESKALMDKIFAIDQTVTWTKIGEVGSNNTIDGFVKYSSDFTEADMEANPVKTRYVKVVFIPYAYPQAFAYCERVSCAELYLKHVVRHNGQPVE